MGDHDELQGHDPVAEEAIKAGPKPKAEKTPSAKKPAKKAAKKIAPAKATPAPEPVAPSHPFTLGSSAGEPR